MSKKTVASILAAIVVCATTGFTQDSRGTITGTVTDSAGAMIAGAEVRAVNKETGAAVNSRTNESGAYTLPFLVPGPYDLTAEFTGFKKASRAGVAVRVNDMLSVDFRL